MLNIQRGTILPEVQKTFGESNDVLDHVSGEVHHMWKSSENTTFPNFFSFLGLLLFKETTQTGRWR